MTDKIIKSSLPNGAPYKVHKNSDGEVFIEIHTLGLDNPMSIIDVYYRYYRSDWVGKNKYEWKTRVNWPGIGSVDHNQALHFAACLQDAAHFAERLQNNTADDLILYQTYESRYKQPKFD
jgi:hypothetical protein